MIELQFFSLKNYKTQEEYRAFIQEKVRTQNVNICATYSKIWRTGSLCDDYISSTRF